MPIITSNPSEFWFHVADQEEIPLAGEVDRSFDVDSLIGFLADLPPEAERFDAYLLASLRGNINLVDTLRTIVGVSDKRMYLELSFLFGRTPRGTDRYTGVSGDSVFDLNTHALQFFKRLAFSANREVAVAAQQLFVAYFKKKQLLQSARALSRLNRAEVVQIVESLILTKEVQQKEAKRRGHGAEFALAQVIHALGGKMIPDERHLHAMGGHDPNVDMTTFETIKKARGKTWSTDIIVLGEDGQSRVFVQSLIHTSDPGQYGVNKSNETVDVKAGLRRHNEATGNAKELWGLVDGVGFAENKADTINKMLAEFDCFIQLKTLYKAGLQMHKIGLSNVRGIQFDESFYTADEATKMYEKYCDSGIVRLRAGDQPDNTWVPVPAGKATLFI